MKIYVASSWRNEEQPALVLLLRKAGHEVYDFRNPPAHLAFKWQDISADWQRWTPSAYRQALLVNTRVSAGFGSDFAAMRWADVCVLLLPSGNSAHIEAGWFAGHTDKKLIILLPQQFSPINRSEPELMYHLADYIALSPEEVVEMLATRSFAQVDDETFG